MAFRLPLASQHYVILNSGNSGSPPAWVHESSVIDVPQSVSPLDLNAGEPTIDEEFNERGRPIAAGLQGRGKATKRRDRSKTRQKTKKRGGKHEKRKSEGVREQVSCFWEILRSSAYPSFTSSAMSLLRRWRSKKTVSPTQETSLRKALVS